MKKLFLTIMLFTSFSIRAADLNIFQILQFSSFNDISTVNLPLSDVVQTTFKPVSVIGYYFLDARVQNIGTDQWMVRGDFKGKGIFLTNRYIPDIRYAYVENKKPVGDHWYFSAGRINPMNLLPIQRLDGANVSYTPDAEKGWLFGLIGGMVPIETSGFRSYYYAPYRVGAYTEYSNKNADHFKVQYNAGFGAGSDIFHQGQVEVTKKYLIFNKDAYIRGGVMFTYPYNTFDYALAENSIYTDTKTIHSVGYMKSDTLFLTSNKVVTQSYQQAFYRFSYTSPDDEWLLTLRGGYTYSMLVHGYIAQAQLMRRKLLDKKNGAFGFDFIAQKKGVYDQISGRVNFGIFPLWMINVNAFAGYEYFNYNKITNNGLLYGITAQGEFAGNFTYELNVDWRTIINQNTDFFASFTLTHLFNTHLGKREEDLTEPGLDKKKESNSDVENSENKSEPLQEKRKEETNQEIKKL